MRLGSAGRGLLGFALLVLVWHLGTLGNSVTDIPGPWLTLRALIEIGGAGVLWQNVIASVFRVAWGFCLAAAIGIPLGVAFGWLPALRQTFNPVVQGFRPISPIAWIPITVLAIGKGHLLNGDDESAIVLIFLSSFFPIVTATNSAVGSIDQKYLRSARNFGVSGVTLFRRVVVPAALPQILTGLRLALGISWVVVVAAEMLGVQQGLGFQINIARQQLRYDYVAAAIVVIAIIGVILDGVMARVEHATLTKRGLRTQR